MDYAKESLRLHQEWKGKIEIAPRAKVDSKEALSGLTSATMRSTAIEFP